MIPLMTLPAGTRVERDRDGRWMFFPPGKPPLGLAIYRGCLYITEIAPECVVELTVGTIPSPKG
jgi:hypothetical protein